MILLLQQLLLLLLRIEQTHKAGIRTAECTESRRAVEMGKQAAMSNEKLQVSDESIKDSPSRAAPITGELRAAHRIETHTPEIDGLIGQERE